MIFNTKFKKDYETAVHVFRPILKSLKFREQPKKGYRTSFLVDIDEVKFLGLSNFRLNVIAANINCGGQFFYRQKGDLCDCYFVISSDLYNTSLEKVKIVGIHEFCHFIALIYTYKTVSIRRQRRELLKRLSKKTDEMNSAILDKFYLELQQQSNLNKENTPDNEDTFGLEYHSSFDDRHYRLNCEGDTCQYDVLFKYLLFSREMFEEYFDKDKQNEFKWLLETNKEENIINAVKLFLETAVKVAKEKSIPRKFAVNQAAKLMKKYLA